MPGKVIIDPITMQPTTQEEMDARKNAQMAAYRAQFPQDPAIAELAAQYKNHPTGMNPAQMGPNFNTTPTPGPSPDKIQQFEQGARKAFGSADDEGITEAKRKALQKLMQE